MMIDNIKTEHGFLLTNFPHFANALFIRSSTFYEKGIFLDAFSFTFEEGESFIIFLKIQS